MRNIDIPQVTDLARLLERRDSIFQGATKQGKLFSRLRRSADSEKEKTIQHDAIENAHTGSEPVVPNEKMHEDKSFRCD